MVDKTIDLICAKCGELTKIALKEYNRQIRNGRATDHFFCSNSCATSFGHEHGKYDNKSAYTRLVNSGKICGLKSNKLSPFKWFIRLAKRRSKMSSKKTCEISVEYLKKLFEQQNGRCPFTNWELALPNSSKSGWKQRAHPRNASLDRIDNSKGYVEGNVRFVSLIANLARQSYDDNTVIEFCKAVVEYKLND